MSRFGGFLKRNIVLILVIIYCIFFIENIPIITQSDSAISIVCGTLYMFSLPLQIILSIAYAVFAFAKQNPLTPLVPILIFYSVYKFLEFEINVTKIPTELILGILIIILLMILIRFLVVTLKKYISKKRMIRK